jgi:hypothetical protein
MSDLRVYAHLEFLRRIRTFSSPLRYACRSVRLLVALLLRGSVPSFAEPAQGDCLFVHERLHDGGGDTWSKALPRRRDPRRIEGKQGRELAAKLRRYVRCIARAARRSGNGSGSSTFGFWRPRAVLSCGRRLRRQAVDDAHVLQRPAEQCLCCRRKRWPGKTAALSRPWWKATARATPCEVALGAPEAGGWMGVARLRSGRCCFRPRRCPRAGPIAPAFARVPGRARTRRRAAFRDSEPNGWIDSATLRSGRSCFRPRRCPCAGPSIAIALVRDPVRCGRARTRRRAQSPVESPATIAA